MAVTPSLELLVGLSIGYHIFSPLKAYCRYVGSSESFDLTCLLNCIIESLGGHGASVDVTNR